MSVLSPTTPHLRQVFQQKTQSIPTRGDIENAARQLPPADREAARKELENLSPAQQEAAEKKLEQLSPGDRDALVKRAQDELENPRNPVTYHVIEGPGIPPTYLIGSPALVGRTVPSQEFTDNTKRLFQTAKKLLPNIVLIQRSRVDAFSDQGVGNGILISKTLILTARHVAELISTSPDKYSLFQIGPDNQFLELTFVSTLNVGTDNSGDPDLALIKVIDSNSPKPITFGAVLLKLKDDIASLGCSEMQSLPTMGTGIITTSVGVRELAGALRRTVFGSSVRSFPGLSGSPVFDTNGEVIAVVTGGVKLYAGTGEKVTLVDQNVDWESFTDWTWVTPIQPFLKQVLKQMQEVR